MTTGVHDREASGVPRSRIIAMLVEQGLSEHTLVRLVRKGILPSPTRIVTPGRGSSSYFPINTDVVLRRMLARRKANPKNFRWDAFPVMLHVTTHGNPGILLPETTREWSEFQIDRALLDLLYSADLAEARRLLFGSPDDPNPGRNLVGNIRRLDQIDPRAIHLYRCTIGSRFGEKNRGQKSIPLDELLPEYAATKKAKKARRDKGSPATTPTEQPRPEVRLGRFILDLEDLLNLAWPPLALHGLDAVRFLECFGNAVRFSNFQSDARELLTTLLTEDTKTMASSKNKPTGRSGIDDPEEIKTREKDRQDLEQAMKGQLLMHDYASLTHPNKPDPDRLHNQLYRLHFIPISIGSIKAEEDDPEPTADARALILGRLNHVVCMSSNIKPRLALRQRFGYCPVCRKIFVKVNAPGHGKVTTCGPCATGIKDWPKAEGKISRHINLTSPIGQT